MSVAMNLRAVRESLGMTPEELAARAGYKNVAMITEIENGSGLPSYEKMKDLANALGVSIYQIKGNESFRKVPDDGIYYSQSDLISLDLFSPIIKVLDEKEINQLIDYGLTLVKAKGKSPAWKKYQSKNKQ